MKRYIPLFEKTNIPKEITLKFGKILFGDFRKKDESDTEYEKKVFNSLVGWIEGNVMGKQPKQSMYKILNELKKLKEYYPKILEPKDTTLYRLIRMPIEKQKEKIFDNFELKGKYYYTKDKHIYIPKSFAQSWTNSEKTCFGFLNMPVGIAKPTAKYGDYGKVVVKANLNKDDLLFDTSFMNALAYDTIKMRQNEIIRLSKKPIMVQYITNDYWYGEVLRTVPLKGKCVEYKGIKGIIYESIGSIALIITEKGEKKKIKNLIANIKKGRAKIIPMIKLNKKILKFLSNF